MILIDQHVLPDADQLRAASSTTLRTACLAVVSDDMLYFSLTFTFLSFFSFFYSFWLLLALADRSGYKSVISAVETDSMMPRVAMSRFS